MDVRKSGTVALEDFGNLICSEPAASYLKSLEIDTSNLRSIFSMLDLDDNDAVYVDEFIEGILRLKGEARSLDLHRLMVTVNRLVALTEDIASSFAHNGCSSIELP